MPSITEIDIRDIAEDFDLEVKKATGRDGRGELPRNLLETYSAMANSYGGVILLGIEEKPKGSFRITGIQDTEKVLKSLWDNLNNRNQISINLLTDQMVEVKKIQGKNVIKISVPRAKRTQRPIYVGTNPVAGTYRRNYEGDYLCSEEMVRRMMVEQIEEVRDARLLENFSFNDIEVGTLRAYRNQFKATRFDHPWLDLDDTQFLHRIGGWTFDRETEKEGLTVAGLLMFGKLRSILDAIPNYVVDYQERPNNATETRWIDRVTTDGSWSGNIYDFYRLVVQKLFRDMKVPFKLDDLRRVDETPVHEAIREALINTLIHADYTGRTPILIVKGLDMFLFRNPGSMRLPLEDALRGGLSDCRNRNIQKMFQLIGYGEQAGSGIPRIYRNWSKQLWRSPDYFENLDPEYTQLTMHMVSLLPQDTLLELDKQFGASFRRLSELQQLALATASIEGSVTNSRLRGMTSAHPHDITRALQILVKNRFLDSSGATRGTFYYLPGSSLKIRPLDLWSDNGKSRSEQTTQNSEHLKSSSEHLKPSSEHLKSSSEHLKEINDLCVLIRGKKKVPKEIMEQAILLLSKDQFLSLRQFAEQLNRTPDTLRVHYLNRLVKEGTLQLRFPDKPNHPDQEYRSKLNGKKTTRLTNEG